MGETRSGDRAGGTSPPAEPWFLRSGARLFGVLLVALGLPTAGFTAAVILGARNAAKEQAISQNTTAAALGAEIVRSHFDAIAQYAEGWARRDAMRAAVAALDEQAIRALLVDLVQGYPSIDRAFVADAGGVERSDYPHDPTVIGKDFSYRDWYRGVSARNATYVSEVYLRAGAPRVDIVAVATPVRAGDGPGARVLGYIVLQHTIRDLTRRFVDVRLGEAGRILLLDKNLHLAEELEGAPRETAIEALAGRIEGSDAGSLEGQDSVSGAPILMGYARVPEIGWVVVAQQPLERVLAPAGELQGEILGLAALSLLGMLLLGWICLRLVRRRQQALVEMQELKDLLSGMIVHDLRNPLTATLASLDLAGKHAADLGGATRKDVARAALAARRMLGMTNDLLDVMRLEEGALELEREPTDLGQLVGAKLEEFQALALEGGASLRAELPLGRTEVQVDPAVLSRVLDNLLTNALKHTPAGGSVVVRLEPYEGRVELAVSDTGEGIPQAQLPRLFQKYGRVQGERSKRSRGVGLGLVFCRMAVEAHGGSIEVDSTLGRGSTFRVVLPVEPPPAPRREPDGAPRESPAGA